MPDKASSRAGERRRYSRFPLPAPVIVVSSGTVQTFPPRDIGAGGLFLYGRDAPAVGSRVQVEFTAGKGRYFSIPAIVVRQDTEGSRPGFAVEFQIPDPKRAELEKALLGR